MLDDLITLQRSTFMFKNSMGRLPSPFFSNLHPLSQLFKVKMLPVTQSQSGKTTKLTYLYFNKYLEQGAYGT